MDVDTLLNYALLLEKCASTNSCYWQKVQISVCLSAPQQSPAFIFFCYCWCIIFSHFLDTKTQKQLWARNYSLSKIRTYSFAWKTQKKFSRCYIPDTSQHMSTLQTKLSVGFLLLPPTGVATGNYLPCLL